MQESQTALTKKAIEASLKGNWKEAVDLNSQILERFPKDQDAKIRLGRAYIQIKEFTKAKKIFKEVLQIDPINSVALKNYKLAAEQKVEAHSFGAIDPKSLIKEPGTTTEVSMEITAKRITSENFNPAEALGIKILKAKAEIYKKGSHGEDMLIGAVNSDLITKLNLAKDKGGTITVNYVNGSGKQIRIIIHSSVPVFKGERQEVKPYIKPGSIDEPEMEIPTDFEE